MEDMHKCYWSFNDNNLIFEGYTNNTKWNGYDNIWIDNDTFLLVLEDLAAMYDFDWDTMFEEIFGGYIPNVSNNKLFSLANGFTTYIV